MTKTLTNCRDCGILTSERSGRCGLCLAVWAAINEHRIVPYGPDRRPAGPDHKPIVEGFDD